MIASLTGIVAEKHAGAICIDVNGVGYSVFVTSSLFKELSVGDEAKLFTRLIVREDSFTLFGFQSSEQAQIFDTLRTVSGIGPKLALGILSQLGIEAISMAIADQNDAVFSAVSGVGAKTAKMLTVSLEGKLAAGKAGSSSTGNEAVLLALVGLGWREKDASEAIKELSAKSSSILSEKELLRACLALLAGNGTGSKN